MSAPTLAVVAGRILTLAAATSGIQRGFDPPPAGIEKAELPAVYVFTGRATYDEGAYGEQYVLERRSYRVQCAVIPTGLGNPNTRETLCRPLLDALAAQLQRYPTLNGLDYVREASVVSDSGIVILPEWGAKFIGFEVLLDVPIIRPRVYAAGE